MKRLLSAVSVMAVICSSAAIAADMSKADTGAKEALTKIHTVNQNEIDMAKMALDKAQSPQVKSFAQRMINDHQKADQKVSDLAKQENITLDRLPFTSQEKADMDRLTSASGGEFDRIYMEINRKGHDKALTMLSKSQKTVDDKNVKNLIGEIKPEVMAHDQLAKNLKPAQKPQG